MMNPMMSGMGQMPNMGNPMMPNMGSPMMPKMGGLDICRKLKKNPETADIPIIASTAKDRDVDRMWAIKQGIKAYVVKPCKQEELVNAIRGAMV